MSTYVFKQTEDELWTVGYYDPQGKWQSESDWNNTDDAAARTRFLNGGVAEPLTELAAEPPSALTVDQQIRLECARLLLNDGSSLVPETAEDEVWNVSGLIKETLRLAAAISTGVEPAPPQDGDGVAATAPAYCDGCGDYLQVCPDCGKRFCGPACRNEHTELGTCPDTEGSGE